MKSELEKYKHKISPDVFKVIQEVIDDPELSKDSRYTCDVCENDPMAHFVHNPYSTTAPINFARQHPIIVGTPFNLSDDMPEEKESPEKILMKKLSILSFIKKILPF